MAAGDITIGRRIPVPDSGDINEVLVDFEPGDYCGPIVGYTGDKPAVFLLKPNGRDADAPALARSVHHVTMPPHRFRECADGSLEIRESLGDTFNCGDGQSRSDGWHGYLDEGNVWRQV